MSDTSESIDEELDVHVCNHQIVKDVVEEKTFIFNILYEIGIHTFTVYFDTWSNEQEDILTASSLWKFIDAGYSKSYGCFIHDYMLQERDLSFYNLLDAILEFKPDIETDGRKILYKLSIGRK